MNRVVVVFCAVLAALVPERALAQPEAVAIDGRIRAQATQVGRELARDPTQTAELQKLVAETPSGDIMQILIIVLHESYQESLEDLKHHASKLSHYNAIAKSLGRYQGKLAGASASLAKCEASREACGPQQIYDRAAKLEDDLGRVEAAIATTAVPAEQGDELERLRDSLQRNRQLIALTRERLTAQPVPSPVETGAVQGVQSAFRPALTTLAQPQTFANPMNGDRRLDLCRVWDAECGQPAADAFCQQRGFARAGAWQPATDIGASAPTRTLGDGLECAAPYCDGFATLTCTP